MKRMTFKFISMLAVMLFSFQSAAEKVVTIATGEYPPLTSENKQNGNFVNDVISVAFQRVGYKAEFTYMPWKRAYAAAKAGLYHGTSYWQYSKERAADFYFSDPVVDITVVFFHLKSTVVNDWKTLSDLSNYKIGATLGYTYSPEFIAAEKAGILVTDRAPSDKMNFQKLLVGRFDLFPMGLLAGIYLLDSEFAGWRSRISYRTKPLKKTQGMFIISKQAENAKEIVSSFNQGLAEIKKDGVYKKMYQDLLAGKYRN